MDWKCFLILCLTGLGIAASDCGGHEFQFSCACENGRCIDESLVCNGRDNCGDGSDETDCSEDCGGHDFLFRCENGRCMYESFVCDGFNDCGDRSDEADCAEDCSGHEFLFRCADDLMCIHKSFVCDGWHDCWGDETDCGVDGGYTDFGDWSACSASCGDGTQTRTRTCTNPAPADGGADCVGPATETRTCSKRDCPEFSLVDQNGNAVGARVYGLLLSNGGTVCDDYFSDNAADAICREMGFTGSRSWRNGYIWRSYQATLEITLDDVKCTSGDWSSCTYNFRDNCNHNEDVFLECDGTDWKKPVAYEEFSLQLDETLELKTTTNVVERRIIFRFSYQGNDYYFVAKCKDVSTSRWIYVLTGCIRNAWSSALTMTGVPRDEIKIWQITRTTTHLRIVCNGERVVNFNFRTDFTGGFSSCSETWGQSNAIQFEFVSWGLYDHDHLFMRILSTVDGGYTDFGDWSACSASRTRTCTNPAPANGGADCVGPATETRFCSQRDCPDTEPVVDQNVSSQYFFRTQQISGGSISEKRFNTINGTIKGPAIHVKAGTWLSVIVTNGIPDNVASYGLSVHWHGLNMRGAQVFDGVVGLTQCPIGYNKSFNYKWLVDEQPGTYWYHTHDRKLYPGNQIDFVRGPFIVHEHDADISGYTLGDDYQSGKERILFYTTPNLLNGEKQPKIEVENGEYRFRIINGDGLDSYFFSIEGHKMTVVSTDAYPIEPYETDVIQVSIAERYDVIVNFNITDSTKNVWIRATPNITRSSNGTFGILKIRKNKKVPYSKTAPPSQEKMLNTTGKDVLNCYNTTEEDYTCHPVTDLTSTVTRNLLDPTYYHTYDIQEHPEGSWQVSIDQGIFAKNEIPCEAAIKSSSRNRWSKNTNILSLPTIKSVTIVLRSKTHKEFHPIHLHGHHFEILEIVKRQPTENCQPVDLQTGFSQSIDKLMNRTKQGVLKDTVFLPPCGAVAVRINSDNRGIWFFHCHINYHLHHGLALVLDEGGYLFSQKRFPGDYPSCEPCE